MGRMGRWARSGAAATGLVLALGCAPMGGAVGGAQWPGSSGDVIDGEVYRVDLRRDGLAIRGYDGRVRAVNVHRDTRVRYDRRTYPVSALERGDEVRVYVTFDRRGVAWADRVDVRRSVREQGRYARPRVTRLDAHVVRIDLRDGWMSVSPRPGDYPVLVHLPRRLDHDDVRRLHRLRRGDRVRLDVVPVRRGEFELVRIR